MELDALLSTTAPDWSGRSTALRLAAQLAVADRQHHRACELLDAALLLEPEHAETRWALIRILFHRGDIGQAWQVLSAAPQPLEPANIADARIWVQLHRRYAPVRSTVEGCLRLLRRFGGSEEFSAFVVMNLSLPGEPMTDLPENLLADVRLEAERFFDRWPDSHLRRLDARDLEQLVANMNQAVRPTDEQQLERRRLNYRLQRGQLPISTLAAAGRRSYAESVVLRPLGVLPARHPDPAEHRICLDAAGAATDQDVTIDTTAIATLTSLPEEIRRAAMAMFASVVTTDETLLDAVNGKDALALRSTDTWIYDEQLDRGRFLSISDDDADRLAYEAASLHAAVEALARFPTPVAGHADDHDEPALITYLSVVDLANDRQIAVWSDDPILRALARQDGRAATSTPAVLQELMRRGGLTTAQHDDAIRALIKARIGDFPLDEQRLLELAEDEGWAPGSVAAALVRPAAWISTMTEALSAYRRLISAVRAHRPDGVPDWFWHAARGVAAAVTQPSARTGVIAHFLVITVHATNAQGDAVANLVAAARMALTYTDNPELPPSPDPLPQCVQLLRDAYAAGMPSSLATQYTLATFAALQEQDRQTVLHTLLR